MSSLKRIEANRRNALKSTKVNSVRAAMRCATASQPRPSLLRSRTQKITKPSKLR